MLAWGKPNCGDADPELFFSQYVEDVALAKEYCVGCPIIDTCREEAISGELTGVWGGTTDYERGRIKSRRYYYKSRAKEEAKARRAARPAGYRVSTSAENIEKLRVNNVQKALKASLAMEAELRRALESMGDEMSPEARETVVKRIEFPELLLAELGASLTRPVTKDVVAGRLRRVRMTLKEREMQNERSAV